MARTWMQDPNTIEFEKAVGEPSRRDVEHQKRRLTTEGQIEPLEVTHRRVVRYSGHWPYGNALIQAARELGWDTLMVTNETDEERH